MLHVRQKLPQSKLESKLCVWAKPNKKFGFSNRETKITCSQTRLEMEMGRPISRKCSAHDPLENEC